MDSRTDADLPALPTIQDVFDAKAIIQGFMPATPLYHYPAVDDLTGTRTWIKHENHTPIGAFKLRGGLFLMNQLIQSGKLGTVVTASTGNHGQSIAYAARVFGVRSTIIVPEGANAVKVEAMRQLGAQVLFRGQSFDEAKVFGMEWAESQGFRFVSSGDEPELIAGVATYTLELMEQQPDLDYLFVPLGGGSGAAGACIVAQALNPNVKVVAVQSRKSPSAFLTWRSKKWTMASNDTFAEGLATAEPFMLPQKVIWQHLHDFRLVDDSDILDAMAHCYLRTKNLVEPAGATALAGVLKMGQELRGAKCAIVISGGNISVEHLRLCVNHLAKLRANTHSKDSLQ